MTLDELREKIEARHQKAMEALEVLGQYLDGEKIDLEPQGSPPPLHKPNRTYRRHSGRQSNRARVLEVISKDWATAQQIADKTRLHIRQVRGVLNAPDAKKLS